MLALLFTSISRMQHAETLPFNLLMSLRMSLRTLMENSSCYKWCTSSLCHKRQGINYWVTVVLFMYMLVIAKRGSTAASFLVVSR